LTFKWSAPVESIASDLLMSKGITGFCCGAAVAVDAEKILKGLA
jgi:hypothetical protein